MNLGMRVLSYLISGVAALRSYWDGWAITTCGTRFLLPIGIVGRGGLRDVT